jgi:hypothetical protein
VDNRHLALLVVLVDLACGSSVGRCPPGTRADEGRARGLIAAVGETRTGRGLMLADAAICFGGAGRGTVRHDGVVVIADGLDGDEGAARLIHMQMHVEDGLQRFPEAGVACDRQLEAVLAAEARGIAAEIEACEELGCAAAPFTFAAAVLAAAPTERVGVVLARLRAEPGTDGLDILVRDYRTRCERGELSSRPSGPELSSGPD